MGGGETVSEWAHRRLVEVVSRLLPLLRPLLAVGCVGAIAAAALSSAQARDAASVAGRDVVRAAKTVADVRAADPQARKDALETLAEAARDDRARGVVREAVVGALRDPVPELRIRAAGLLASAYARDPTARAAVFARLADEPDEETVAALLLAFGALAAAGDPGEAARLDPYLTAPSVRLRAAAATAAGDLGGAAARARLLAVLASPGDDPDWAVRGAVLLALVRCGRREDAGAALVAYREGGGVHRWFARASLATVVGALDVDPVPVLAPLVADDDPRVASAAALALVRSGRVPEAVARLADARAGVRAACAAALGAAGVASEAAALRRLATGDPDRGVRFSATLALFALDDPAADPLLVAAVESDDPLVSTRAVEACRRKTGLALGRDGPAWGQALAARRAASR